MTTPYSKQNKTYIQREANLVKAFEWLIGQKSLGGNLLSLASSFIPGGQFFAPAISTIDQLATNKQSKPISQILPLNTNPYGQMSKGGSIHINPENRGKFNATKARTGKTTEELTHSKNPLTRKRAIFAQNAAKWKHAEGGPLNTKEMLTGLPISSLPNTTSSQLPVLTMPVINTELNSSKSKSKDRFREKEMGGVINNGFKQYDTGSHASGNDLAVDSNGNANSSSAVASVQNKENMFKVKGKPYIMSDTLTNPETGRPFNVDAMKVNKKYPNAKFQEDQKNALEFKMTRLANLNDAMKSIAEASDQMAKGGYLHKMYGGGNPGDPIRNRPYMTPTGEIVQPNNDALTVEPMVDPINPNIPTARDPFAIKTNEDYLPANYSVADPENTPVLDNTNLFGSASLDRSNTDSVLSPESDQSPSTAPSSNTLSTERGLGADSANAIAIGLKAAGLTKSIVDSLTPAEVEQPVLPNYQKADNYLKRANINYNQARQDAAGASNIAANVNRSASSNFASYQAREMGRVANLQDSLSRISEMENNQQSQLNVTKANYEQGKAIDTANRLTQNRINNQQNKANADFADQKLFTELTQVGTEFNKYANFKKQVQNNKELQNYYVNEGLAILNNKYPNFKLDSTFMEKLQSGQASADDVVKFWSTVQKLETKNGNN